MSIHDSLLNRICSQLNIQKGATESMVSLTARALYSVLGLMGLASLWDTSDDETVSVRHFKQRITQLISDYAAVFPELNDLLAVADEIASRIYGIYLSSGYFYHTPHRLAPPALTLAASSHTVFVRGAPPSWKVSMSGLGTYLTSVPASGARQVSPGEMFGLSESSLTETWTAILRRASWTSVQDTTAYQFLNHSTASNRVWTEHPSINADITVARTTSPGIRSYFLFKQQDGSASISQLPDWMISSKNFDGLYYQYVTIPCLNASGSLRPVRYRFNGNTAVVSFFNCLQPAEAMWLKLYSWPASLRDVSNEFKRIMDRTVFDSIRQTLTALGYKFEEDLSLV